MTFAYQSAEEILEESIDYSGLKNEYLKLFHFNRDLMEGLYYASTIQQGLLPQKRHFERLFDEYFILYRPQQIVGGDFYWTARKGNKVVFACADCTGHGVGGAMLSVLGLSYLNYVVLGKEFDNLAEILKEVDKKWMETFCKFTDIMENNDWMEISLCSFDAETRELCFAGARGSVLLIDDKNQQFLKGNRYPIGGWQIERNRVYDVQKVVLEKPTSVYLGSDGFKDQLGGRNNKKLSARKLNEMIGDIYDIPMGLQSNLLKIMLEEWQGKNEQTDDICLMGIKL
jgi:serine phosphatase RsbU (regulator of sigma subunit)